MRTQVRHMHQHRGRSVARTGFAPAVASLLVIIITGPALALALTLLGALAAWGLRWRRGLLARVARAGFPALLLLLSGVAEPSSAHGQDCGGDNQRACCLGEASFGPCRDGLTEVNDCVGIIANCDCGGGSIFDARSHCRQASPCGKVGQRACCGGELINGQPCESGLFEIVGCVGDCFCGGDANPFAFNSSGTCVTQTTCGARGERSCCLSDRFFDRCDPNQNLVEVPGCSGDCYCKNGFATGMCTVLESIDEPSTNRIDPPANAPTTAAPSCPLLGYADLHVHMFADMAHGGAVLAGKPYAPHPDPFGKVGINQALEQDFTTLASLVDSDGNSIGAPTLGLCPPYINVIDPNNGCGERFFHGDHDEFAGDPVGSDLGTQDGAASNLGVPIFNGWPRWSSTTHQQTYYKWLERAWQGGMRLITMLAVTNEALCRGSKRLAGTNCVDSMAAIDDQLAEARRFESFVDEQFGTDAQDKGWFRIVETPAEARQVIAQGKLAVVLGIEVAELFNCKFPIDQCVRSTTEINGVEKLNGFIGACNFSEETNGRPPENSGVAGCTPEYIRGQVEKYYDLGVRHVFPIHNFDNAFGAAATWQDGIEVGNRVVEDHWWQTRNCFLEGYGFGLGFFTQTFISLLKFGDEIDITPIRFPFARADCNNLGLFPLGRILIEEMMDRGMFIDVDHVSNRAFDDILDLTEARDPNYPVVATHVLSFDLHTQEVRHERHRTRAQLERIKSSGGMIAAMLKDEVQDTGRSGERQTVDYAAAEVRDDCRYSSKTFAQAYAYAVDVMGSPVALGSDFNGVAGHFGPRFGNEACGGDLAEQKMQYQKNDRLQYPFTIPGFGTFDKQKTGDKTYDYNGDGMAHVGLVPDFVADLKTIGMAQSDLDMLFRSADQYVRVWERQLGVTPAADAPACRQCTGISVGPAPLFSDTTLFFIPTGGVFGGPTTATWNFGDGLCESVACTTDADCAPADCGGDGQCEPITCGTDSDCPAASPCNESTGSGLSATHQYTRPGTFTVRTTVTDRFGSAECVGEVTVNDSNDTATGAQIAFDAPDQTVEGTEALIRIRHSTLWTLDAAGCGSDGQLVFIRATNGSPPAANEYDMGCFYPGGLERNADAFATARPANGDPITRTHRIRIVNAPPVIVADPIAPVPWGTPLDHTIVLGDVAGDVLDLDVSWGDDDDTSETFTGLTPGPFRLQFQYPTPSRFGTPFRIRLALSDDVDTVNRILNVEVPGPPPDVVLAGTVRTSSGGMGVYSFSADDPDGGRAVLGSLSCGGSGELGAVVITRDVPPNPLRYAALCNFSAADPANVIALTMIDDEQRTGTAFLQVVIGSPPTGQVGADSSPATVDENTSVRFLADGFATEGDPITVENVTCDDVPVPNPIVTTLADEQKLVDFTCTTPDGPSTITAAVTFSDFDGEVTVMEALPVVNVPCVDSSECDEGLFCEQGGECVPVRQHGEPCSGDDACASTFCTDAVCCASRCDEEDVACNLSGSEGVCTSITVVAPAMSRKGLVAALLVLCSVAAIALRRRRRGVGLET